MAHSFTEALVRAGVIQPEDTPEARAEREWQERRRRQAAEAAARMDETDTRADFEAPASATIVERGREDVPAPRMVCADCGEPFDPTAAQHKPFGRTDQCGPCALGETPGPKRKRGQMVWTHKTAPTLEIEGGPTLSPEDLAAMRRR